MLTRVIVAALIVISALVALPGGDNGAASAEPRGARGRSRGRSRGRGWGQQQYQPENPLGGFLGGILGGWLSNQMREDEEPQPNAPFYNEDDGDEPK